jgi:predicted small lipoprotein YifL
MRRVFATLLLLALASSVSACACRPGYIGPRGGVHPGGCIVY